VKALTEAVFTDDFDLADDVLVELVQLFGGESSTHRVRASRADGRRTG
jgi:hypothetical protein